MHEINVANKIINITNPDKILFIEANLTKMDLINYYLKVADHLLPHVKDRPITIQCFPEGVKQEGFYRQYALDTLPSWFETFSLKNKYGVYVEHLLCQDTASLIYLVNYNMVSMFRWLSKVENPESPDLLAIEIIPPNEAAFHLVCKAAKLLKIQLETRNYQPYVMTTGSNSLLVMSRSKQNDDYAQVREMLFELVAIIIKEYPTEFSVNVRKNKRGELVYIDIMRNSYAQSVITPFSIKAEKHAYVATPLSWKELEKPDSILNQWNINNIFTRLNNLVNDPWTGLESKLPIIFLISVFLSFYKLDLIL